MYVTPSTCMRDNLPRSAQGVTYHNLIRPLWQSTLSQNIHEPLTTIPILTFISFRIASLIIIVTMAGSLKH